MMNKHDIETMIKEFESSSLTKLSLELENFKICLEKNTGSVVVAQPVQSAPVIQEVKEVSKNTINSPLVGTFYLTRSPNTPPLISVGQTINVGDVIGIVEAMKVMNEIQATTSGVVKAILAPSGKLVEYNQPLIELQ